MATGRERRKTTRVRYDYPVEVFLQKGISLQGEIKDLSLKGAYITGVDLNLIETGEVFRFKIMLKRSKPALGVNVSARVVRKDSCKGIGISFSGMDIESLTNLRRLVEINCGEEEKIVKELRQFIR